MPVKPWGPGLRASVSKVDNSVAVSELEARTGAENAPWMLPSGDKRREYPSDPMIRNDEGLEGIKETLLNVTEVIANPGFSPHSGVSGRAGL